MPFAFCLFACPLLAPGFDTNSYRAITAHNAFGLTPPPSLAPARPDAASASPGIVLDGIMSVFDRHFALFKIHGDEKTHLLAEGQSDGDIELLSVNTTAGTVQIKNHGALQTVALAKPPETPPQLADGRATRDEGQPSSHPPTPLVNGQATTGNIQPSNLGPGPSTIPVSGLSGQSGTPAGDTDSQNSGSAAPADPPSEPWWVVGSRNMEAARIATAELVESGQADPYPLTPLTPPGTPAALIGPGQLYFVRAAITR